MRQRRAELELEMVVVALLTDKCALEIGLYTIFT